MAKPPPAARGRFLHPYNLVKTTVLWYSYYEKRAESR